MDNYYILILFNTKMPELGNNTNPDWLDYRLDLFQRYTLKSLINQTDGIFRVWMMCLEESEDILMPKIEIAKKKNPMMGVVHFIFDEQVACNRLKDHTEPTYFLKLDSDDMYHKNTIRKTRQILGPPRFISMIMFCDGYIYDIHSKKMTTFVQWSPPNIAVKYTPGTFNRESFHKYCMGNISKVRERLKPITLSGRMVCCLDHDMNLHSDPRRKGVELEKRAGQDAIVHQDKIPGILKEFGVER